MNTKNLAIGGLLVSLAVMFQTAPVLFTEIFTPITILSALPIYIIARLNPRLGFAAFFITALLTMFLSVHEGLFYICTNGPVGLTLGICSHYTKRKAVICSITAIILMLAISIMNFLIGIPVFGVQIPGLIYTQMATLLAISVIYSTIYFFAAGFIFKILSSKVNFF